MSSRKIEDCVPKLQTAYAAAKAKFAELYPDLPQPFLTCTHRPNAEQEALYAIGRTKPGKKVTNARAGQSKHNKLPSEAIDIAFVLFGKLDWSQHLFQKFADIIVPMGVEWSGSWVKFKEAAHYQV